MPPMQAHSSYPAFFLIKPLLRLDFKCFPTYNILMAITKHRNPWLELPSRAVWRQVVSNINGPREIRRCMRRIYTGALTPA